MNQKQHKQEPIEIFFKQKTNHIQYIAYPWAAPQSYPNSISISCKMNEIDLFSIVGDVSLGNTRKCQLSYKVLGDRTRFGLEWIAWIQAKFKQFTIHEKLNTPRYSNVQIVSVETDNIHNT